MIPGVRRTLMLAAAGRMGRVPMHVVISVVAVLPCFIGQRVAMLDDSRCLFPTGHNRQAPHLAALLGH